MNRNVAVQVGAFLRSSHADPKRSAAELAQSSTFTVVRICPLLPRHQAARVFANSSPRAFSSTPPVAAPSSRANVLRSLSESPLQRNSLKPGHVHERVTTAFSLTWRRHAHKRALWAEEKRNEFNRRRTNSSQDEKPKEKAGSAAEAPKEDTAAPAPVQGTTGAPQAELSPQPSAPPKPTPEPEPSSHGKHLLDRLPHSLPHIYRPTKAELLEAASGFWSRLKIHFKWITIRSNRKFNADEIYALFSWVLAAHIVWIVVGTTTFFSLTIFLINTVFAQETLAKWIGNYLTKSSGMKVVFESAVVPKWKDGVITFRKVFVSRRPGQGQSKVSKGSQTSAAAEAAAMAQKERDIAAGIEEEEDTNYTQFDISIDTVNVTLSFSKWVNGKGLLKDVEIKGIRGVVDRTFLETPEEYIDPRTYKHTHQPGDFELDSFKMEDLLVTVYQPNNFRPFSVSIYSCDLPQLRKQWLFYDFLSANMMSGSFDNSLFTIHPRQSHNYAGLPNEEHTEDGRRWKKQSRIRIDGLNIDHVNRGYEGPFSWIYEGNLDIVADVMLPSDDDESIAKVMSDMYDRVEATVTNTHHKHFTDHSHDLEETKAEPKEGEADEDHRFIIMDVRVHLNDVRAAVPIFTRDISYVNNALVRPIVAYINAKKTFIPVNCRVVKKANDFEGSWTPYDSGLMDDLSREMYDAFAHDVLDDNRARKRRIKKVGIWTLQLAAQALFLGLAGNVA